jgi:hypothetical protein
MTTAERLRIAIGRARSLLARLFGGEPEHRSEYPHVRRGGAAQWVVLGSNKHSALVAGGWKEGSRRWVQDSFWSVLMVREHKR